MAAPMSHIFSLLRDTAEDDTEQRSISLQKTKPMGVGGMGMLSTANYVARKYGIRSAM